jgi:hypothetical protein
MDNLFNSQKLFTALHIAEALAHGVARTNARGVPPLIIQKEEKNKDRAEKLRGTTLAAKLHDSDACLDLFVCVCVYSLTGCESLCHDGVSTHRPVLSPNLEAALNKIKVLPQ